MTDLCSCRFIRDALNAKTGNTRPSFAPHLILHSSFILLHSLLEFSVLVARTASYINSPRLEDSQSGGLTHTTRRVTPFHTKQKPRVSAS